MRWVQWGESWPCLHLVRPLLRPCRRFAPNRSDPKLAIERLVQRCGGTRSHITFVSDSHYQSTLDAVYAHVVPWSEFPIVHSYPHYPHGGGCGTGSQSPILKLRAVPIGTVSNLITTTAHKCAAVPRQARTSGS